MKQKITKRSLPFSRPTYLLILLFSCSLSIAQTSDGQVPKHEKSFDGPYLGVNVGAQNIFGGALIDELDVLSQKSGFVLEFSSGYRWQFSRNKLVFGAELQYGITDGNLEQTDTRNQMKIDYENNSQFGYGLNFGVALGKKRCVLLTTYAYITRRSFDINIRETTGFAFTQKDVQRFIRYGLVLESPIYKRLHLKASIGRIYVDYGDLETNMDVDDKWDIAIGANYQF